MTTLSDILKKGERPIVGQEVFVVRPGSWDNSYYAATVKSVSPTCRSIVIKQDISGHELTFINGEDTSSSPSKYRRSWLDFDIDGIKRMKREKEKRVLLARKLNEAVNHDHVGVQWNADAIKKRISDLKRIAEEAEKITETLND
jgi:hypothetical protein